MQTALISLKRYGPIIGLGIIIWLVFNPAVHFGFLFWDDPDHIVDNPHLQPPFFQWPQILWIFSFDTSLRFEPVAWLGHILVCALFGKNAGAYHFCLIILHFINSLLVYKLCLRVLSKFATEDVPRETVAFIASAFWAINAVRVEPLGLSADLPYPLTTLLILGSFHFYLVSIDRGRLQMRPYVWSFLLNALAVCTWPISVGFAFCLPFFDQVFFAEGIQRRWHWHSPGFTTYWSSRILFTLPSIASGLAMIHARLHPVGTYALFTGPVPPFDALRLLHGVYAWSYIYLHQFWPFGLTPGHYPWPNAGFHQAYLFAFIGLVGALVLAWRKRSASIWAVLAASFCLAGPMLGLVEAPATPTDRYTYLPDAFFALLLAWIAGRFWSRHPTAAAARITLGAGVVLLPLIGLQSQHQLQIWRNSYTLFSYLQTTPEIRSQPGLQDLVNDLKAGQLVLDGDLDAAVSIYKDLVRREPENYNYWHQLGAVLHRLGNNTEALKAARMAYALDRNPLSWQLIQSIQADHRPDDAALAGDKSGSQNRGHAGGQ